MRHSPGRGIGGTHSPIGLRSRAFHCGGFRSLWATRECCDHRALQPSGSERTFNYVELAKAAAGGFVTTFVTGWVESYNPDAPQVVEEIGGGAQTRTADLGIMRLFRAVSKNFWRA